MSSTPSPLATILQTRREALGLTPVAAARLSGVSLAGLRNIELGQRRLLRFDTVAKLARAYDLNLNDLGSAENHDT